MRRDERTGRPEPGADDIEGRILSFLQQEILGPDVRIGRDEELLSSGVVDSLGVLRLASFVGEAFQVTIQPADFVVENFKTVSALAHYVRRSTSSSGGAGARARGSGT